MTNTEDRATRLRLAMGLAVPLIVFLMVPNAVSLVTLTMVGHLGTAAVAGMGIANVVFAMLLALLYGFDTGTQAVVARATGAGQPLAAGQALCDALAGSVTLGALLALFLYVEGPRLVALLLHDPAAVAAGTGLLHGLAPSALFLSITIVFNAYWIGTGATRIPFAVQLVLVPVQIAATFAGVFGVGDVPAMGVFGAGLASTVTTAFGFAVQGSVARLRHVPLARPRRSGTLAIVAIGWPVSLQQSFLQFGLMLAYAIVAQLGVTATAMLNVLASLTMVPIQCAAGVGMAAATLVGQALGRGDARDAARWGWQMAFGAAAVLGALGLFAVLAPRLLLQGFLHEAPSIAAAVLPVQLLGASLAVDVFVRVLNFALRGAGATKAATAIPFVVQWVMQLPAMWLVGVTLHTGMTGIVSVQIALTVVEAAAFAIVWQRGRWAAVRIGGLAPLDKTYERTVAAPQRIAVLGGAGAGKSTLTRAIGARLNLPVIHLDPLVYGANWTRLPPGQTRARLGALLGTRWVVDGTHPQVHDLTLAEADLVLWIEQPALKRLWRAWRKARLHRGKARIDRPDGCEEGFGWHSVWTVLRFGRWSRRLEAQLTAATCGRVVRLKGDRAVARFVETLGGCPQTLC